MDGVIFDSMPYHAKAWSEAFAKEGIKFTPYQVYLQEGCTGDKTVNDVFMAQKGRVATREEIENIYKEKCRIFATCGEPVPMKNMLQVLEALKKKGYIIGMVTGSGQKSLLQTLDRFYPGIFVAERMVTAYDVTKGKPDPEPYLMGLKKCGVTAAETVVVENAPMGVTAAKAAGIDTIAVNTGILSRDTLAHADLVLDSTEELLNLVNS